MNILCRTIDDYRKVRAVVKVNKRDRSKLKRNVRTMTLRALTNDDAPYSHAALRAYRKLWHEARAHQERITLSRRAINASA